MVTNLETGKLSIAKILDPGTSFTFGETTYRDGDQFGPMTGCQLEAIYLRTGQVEIQCDDDVFYLSAPGIALVASRHRLEYRYGPASMCNVLWCQYISGNLDVEKVSAIAPFCGLMDVSPAATSLIKTGAGLPIDIYSDMHDFCSALGIAVLEELLTRRKLMETVAEIQPQVQLVRRHIEENLGRTITMGTLAGVSGLSPQHLNRLYNSVFGENPIDYLWRLRVRRGAYLLRHTGMQISQIAYQTGFKTPNHFSRKIRERYHMTPRKLRETKWRGHGEV